MTQFVSSWFFDKTDLKHTPSVLDGLSLEVEQRYRREGARFIIKVGSKMNLRYDTMATGVVYFHRFYMCHSFLEFPRFITACCCLFLAGKVEETPKKCKDIIKIAKMFVTEAQYAKFGEDPKEEVLTLERILLQTINFDLQVDHPYNYLLKYAKCLIGDKEKIQKIVQMAWTFINDSLCTTICLQWEPEIIAIALMFLAGKLSKFEVTDWEGRTLKHVKWWDMFVEDISTELLEDICHQVLDLYSMPIPETPQDSPPPSPSSLYIMPNTPNPPLPRTSHQPAPLNHANNVQTGILPLQTMPPLPAQPPNLPTANVAVGQLPTPTTPLLANTGPLAARVPINPLIPSQPIVNQTGFAYRGMPPMPPPTIMASHMTGNSTGPPMPMQAGSVPSHFYRFPGSGPPMPNSGAQSQMMTGPPSATYPNLKNEY